MSNLTNVSEVMYYIPFWNTPVPDISLIPRHVYPKKTPERDAQVLFQFLTEGIVLNVVGLLGLIGNIISMIILSRPQMRSSINYLLIGLARCDTVLIITSILLFGLPAINTYTGYLFEYHFRAYAFIAPFLYPISIIAQTVSVYLTVIVTLERFVAVCHPLQARSYCTYGRARLYVWLTVIFATLYNGTRFFEVDCCNISYDEKLQYIMYEARPTKLRRHPLYINVYINGFYVVFIYMVPFIMLAVLNAAIYRQIQRANAERQRLSRLQKREIGLATMLLCVVVVFFFCNILALVANTMEAINGLIIDQLIKTSNMLVTINSSVNFVIYVIYGKKFKRLFLKLFCPQGKLMCGSPAGGRESPECDSVVSNGDGRTYSVRSTMQLHRTNTTLLRNGSRSTAATAGCARRQGAQGGDGPSDGPSDSRARTPSVATCANYSEQVGTSGNDHRHHSSTATATTVLDE